MIPLFFLSLFLCALAVSAATPGETGLCEDPSKGANALNVKLPPSPPQVSQCRHLDSTMWDEVEYRHDDIVLATTYKSGTHWTDEIIRKLKFQGVSDPSPQLTAPLWVDFYQQRQIALDKISQYPTDHRRVLLTHLPLHSIQYSTKAKYIFVSRDGRDVFLSLARHYANISPARYEYINSNPNRIGDPFPTWDEQGYTIPSFFDDWINKGWNSEYRAEQTDGYPMWSFFDVVKSYWDFNHLENVLFVNYIDLISDLDGSIRRMAKFLEIPIQEDNFADLVQSLTFEGMKAAKNLQQEITSKDIFKEGVTILNKGRTENWKTELTEAQLARYDEVLQVKLSSECIRWLVGGVSSLG